MKHYILMHRYCAKELFGGEEFEIPVAVCSATSKDVAKALFDSEVVDDSVTSYTPDRYDDEGTYIIELTPVTSEVSTVKFLTLAEMEW